MSIFDGMAGILNGVFGDPVTHTPAGGAGTTIQAVFREGPVQVLDDDSRVILSVTPTLKVQRPVDEALSRRDLIQPGNGKTYQIVNDQPNGSPASDAFVFFELEEVLS